MCCTTGTTAFPTLRWLGKNDPDTNTWVGTRNLVDACREGKECGRFVFVSSAGVKRCDAGPPYSILNAFGVLVATLFTLLLIPAMTLIVEDLSSLLTPDRGRPPGQESTFETQPG